jgi:prepilin-type N-terminal cleavage/methylation domain-containing protein
MHRVCCDACDQDAKLSPRENMKPSLPRPHRIARTVPEGPPATAFSLLEMMTVLALLLIFASFALPTYQNIVIRTREAALRDDLYTLRSMIDRFGPPRVAQAPLPGLAAFPSME